MRIDLANVPANGVFVVDSLEVVDVPEAFGTVSMFAEVRFTGEMSRIDRKFLLKGVITAEVPMLCALCLKDVKYTLRWDVREVFSRGRDDIDDWLVEDNSADINPVVRSNLLMALPSRVLCAEDCKGLCPVCGRDLNEGECQHRLQE